MGNSLYGNIAVNANDINKRSKVLLDQVLELKKNKTSLMKNAIVNIFGLFQNADMLNILMTLCFTMPVLNVVK